MIRVLCLFGVVAMMFSQVASAQTISDFRAKFLSDGVRECVVVQREDSQNRGISDRQLSQYCECVMKSASETLTLSELEEMGRTGVNPQSAQTKLNSAGASCISNNFDAVLVERGKNGCVAKNKAAIASFTAAKIDEYCGCVHSRLISKLTKVQKTELMVADKPLPWLQAIVDEADGACKRAFLSR
jgi:hypothetical protein